MRTMPRTISRRALVLGGLALMAAFPARAKTVLEVADETGAFSTFLKAMKTTGLKETVDGEGPFTIFAPTDDAFTKLSKKTYTSFFAPESVEAKERLRALLKNHIVEGTIVSDDLAGRRREAVNMLGSLLPLSGTRGFMVGSARVTRADILADNGIVHVLDTVILPK